MRAWVDDDDGVTEFDCGASDDMIVYMQIVPDGAGQYAVVTGIARGVDTITQHIVRSLDAGALALLRRDISAAVDRGEDCEPVLTTWCAMR
jgi:hypothetical protein